MTDDRSAPETDEPSATHQPVDTPEPDNDTETEADTGSSPGGPTPDAPPAPPAVASAEPQRDEPDGDIIEEAATPRSVNAKRRGSRQVLAALFWLMASLMVLVSAVAVWAHQTLLTSDGWGGIVEDVIGDDEVTDALAVVIVDRLADSLEIQSRVADAIPGPDIIAGAVTSAVQDRVTGFVADFARSDAFESAFVNVNKAAHDAAMTAIRGGDGEALTSGGGILQLDILPLIEGVLYTLQDSGLIDASREIPDLTNFEASDQAVALVEQVLGRDIPDDVGTIVLIESERLELVQTVVRWFDLITALSLLLWVLFTGLALWLTRTRIRMVLWLGGGAIAALLTARVVTRLLLEAITRRQPELEARLVVSATIDAAVDSLLLWTFVLMLVALIVAIAAVVYERRDRLQRPSLETPPRTLGRWVRDNAAVILVLGLGIIAVVAVWSIGGAGIGMLTASAILLLVIGVKVLADQADGEPGHAAEG